MEADLARFYGIDYRDRWRADEHSRPRLTLRMIAVRIRHIPLESAIARLENDGNAPWTRVEQLLDELRRHLAVLAGVKKPKPDPGRRVGEVRHSPKRQRNLAAARARKRERDKRLAPERARLEALRELGVSDA